MGCGEPHYPNRHFFTNYMQGGIMLYFAVLLFAFETNTKDYPVIQQMHKEAQTVRESSGINQHPELDEECCKIAQNWANHMAQTNSMYHGGGEQIIAMGYDTPRMAMSAWRNSSGHWAWLGSRSDLCGWGCQRSANGTWYWAGVFRNKHTQQVTVQTSQNTTNTTYNRRRFFRR